MMKRLSRHLTYLAAISTLFAAAHAQAAELPDGYPDKDLTFVAQSSAGGGTDLMIRALVNAISANKLISRQILVENRPGGAGTIGYNTVAQQKGKPYYFAMTAGSFFTNALRGHAPISYRDFTPVAGLAGDPYIMVVRKGGGLETIDDIKRAKSLRIGSTGAVTDQALLGHSLGRELSVPVRIMPYGGGGEVLTALLGGHLDIQFGNPSEVMSQIRAGAVVPVAVSSGTRLKHLPDVPTLKESGIDVEHTQLRGVVMPADMPKEVVAYWEGVLLKAAKSDEWRNGFMSDNSLLEKLMTSEEFAKEIVRVNEVYSEFVKSIK